MHPGVIPLGDHGAGLPIAVLRAQNLLGQQDRETQKGGGDKAQCWNWAWGVKQGLLEKAIDKHSVIPQEQVGKLNFNVDPGSAVSLEPM